MKLLYIKSKQELCLHQAAAFQYREKYCWQFENKKVVEIRLSLPRKVSQTRETRITSQKVVRFEKNLWELKTLSISAQRAALCSLASSTK